MNVWPRALALAVAVVIAALVLKVSPPLVVLLIFVAALAVAYSAARRVRERERRPALGILGLESADGDQAKILSLPLSLFGRVKDAALDDVVRGRWRSVEVWSFNLSFEAPAVLGPDGERPTFTCALAATEAARPGLVVEPQGFVAPLGGPAPGPEVRTGETAFDDAWSVWGDEGHSRELLGSPVREWLRSLDRSWGIEIRDGLVLVYGPGPDRQDPIAALETLRALLGHLRADLTTPGPPTGEPSV
jgi:hypothetical protein